MTTPAPDQVWSLESRHLGQRVHVHDRLDSTNSLALALRDDPARHGLVLLAREQSAGRGQYGRSWHAPPGSSVLMSVLLFPPISLRRPVLLTAWAAVSVCEAVRKLTGLQAKIKWPNDVLVQGKKVCGILIEQRTTVRTDFPLATAVGIGLNLTQTAALFAAAGLPLAGSLSSLSGFPLHHEDAVKELICQLDEQYHLLLADEGQMLECLWRERLGLVGESVVAEGFTQNQRGRLLALTLAEVVIETEAGEIVRLAPESIRHLDIS